MSRVAVLFAVVLPVSAVSLAASAGVSAAAPVMPLGGAGPVAPGAGPDRPWLGAGPASQHPAAGPRRDEGTPTPAGTSADAVACVSVSDCLAVGSYAIHSGAVVDVTLAARWNGSAWSAVPSPNPAGALDSYLNGISCISASDCLAVGYYASRSNLSVALTLAERWNGSAWSLVPSGNPAGAMGSFLAGASCLNARHCVAVGNYVNRNGLNATLAESWDGSAWSVVPTPRPRGDSYRILSAVSCASGSDCWAAGHRLNAAGSYLTLAEHWNGSAWSVVNWDADLAAISCNGATACLAVGSRIGRHDLETTLVEHWNGTRWAVVPSPDPRGARGSYLHGISCPAAGRCLAAGNSNNAARNYVTLTERWNGAKWTIVPSPNPSVGPPSITYLQAISCASTRACLATGGAGNPANIATLGERWNGCAWRIVPTRYGH